MQASKYVEEMNKHYRDDGIPLDNVMKLIALSMAAFYLLLWFWLAFTGSETDTIDWYRNQAIELNERK